MSKTFPKDCTENCPYYKRWDLSVDDYTNVCDKLHIQVDDCDAYGPFYIPRFCPLAESEEVTNASSLGNKNQYDICWETGQYSDQICELCPYKSECSGYENHND